MNISIGLNENLITKRTSPPLQLAAGECTLRECSLRPGVHNAAWRDSASAACSCMVLNGESRGLVGKSVMWSQRTLSYHSYPWYKSLLHVKHLQRCQTGLCLTMLLGAYVVSVLQKLYMLYSGKEKTQGTKTIIENPGIPNCGFVLFHLIILPTGCKLHPWETC